MKLKIRRVYRTYFLVLLLFFLLGILTLEVAKSVLMNIAESSIVEITGLTRTLMEAEVDNAVDYLGKVSRFDVVKDTSVSIDKKVDFLEQFKDESNLADIGIATLEGWVYSSNRRGGVLIDDRLYFQKGREGEIYIEGPLESRTDSSLITVIGMPIYTDDTVSSVIVAIHKIEYLSEIIDEIDYLGTGHVYVIDASGAIIAAKDRAVIGERWHEHYDQASAGELVQIERLEKDMILRHEGFSEFSLEGEDWVMGYAPIDGTTWSVAVTVDEGTVMGTLNGFKTFLMILLVVSGLITICLSVYFSVLKTRVKAQERLSQNAIDAAKILVIRINERHEILEANVYARRLLVGKGTKLVGRLLDTFLDVQNQEKLKELISDESDLDKVELMLNTSKNQTAFVTFFVASDMSEGLEKRNTSVQLMGLEVTDRVLANREIKEKHEELTSLYEELTASEEEIRTQYDKLENNSKILEHMAYHDSLTGIPNRQMLRFAIEQTIVRAINTRGKFAVFFIDVDDFKYVNDKMGHGMGDQLLIDIAKRLTDHLKNTDTQIFRIGGDEFLVLCDRLENKAEMIFVADRILGSMTESFNLNEKPIHVSLSVGVSVFPDNSTSFEELLKHADIAMYKAKEEGKNRYVFFDYALWDEISQRLLLEEKLGSALDKDALMLYYQPIVNLHTRVISGFEALIRWQLDTGEIISPNRFISIAESNGLIIPIGKWVLESACKFLVGLGREDLTISVNVSVIQLTEDHFVEDVLAIVKKTGIDRSKLTIEITESVLMENVDANLDKLHRLRDNGIRLALDDFGEGYSSFSYLKNLPISILKIDKAFIEHVIEKNDQTIMEGIVALGHQLSLDVVAEGVESESQLRYVDGIQCDMVQGYYYSKPLPASDVPLFLDKGLISQNSLKS